MSDQPWVASPGDVEIELYNPNWMLAGRLDQFDGFDLEEHDDGIKNLKFTMPLEDLKAFGLYASGLAQCPVVVYIRGAERFSGIVTVCEDEDRDGGGSSPSDVVVDVHVEAVVDWHYHMLGREVKGSGGGNRYTRTTTKPNDAVRDLIDANCKSGSTVDPPAYALLGTSGVDRANFGAHRVQGASSGTHPDTIAKMRWDNGESLWHVVMEACRRYDLYITSIWNKTASPPLMTVTANYPRQGTDKTGTVAFQREDGSLVRFKRKVDHLKHANVAEMQGKGTRANQVKGYAIHQPSYDGIGLRETGDLWPSAWQEDADEEAKFIIAQIAGSDTTYEAVLREGPGKEVGVDLDLRDKITISDSVRDVTVQDYISRIKWSMSGAGPLNVEIGLGRPEQSDSSRGGRSGGGRSGSGRKGGKPKGKNGEPETVRQVETNDGTVVFDQVDDKWKQKGETGTRIRWHHAAVADPATEDGDEETVGKIYGNFFAGCPTCNGYVLVFDPSRGYDIMLLARDPGPGGPGGGGGGG